MGREIRRVPEGWEHPKDERGRYIPLRDQSYEAAAAEYMAKLLDWEANGEDRRKAAEFAATRGEDPARYFWDWEGHPPHEEDYRPEFAEGTQTHYQLYENVTEGTPVSPVLASMAEMGEWLESNGYAGWARDSLMESGYCPSGIVTIKDRDP